MKRVLFLLPCALLLGGCALLAEGALEAGGAEALAGRAAIAEGGALARGAAMSGDAAAAGESSFFVDGDVSVPRAGRMGAALQRVANSQGSLVLRDGVVRVGSQEVAALNGAGFYADGQLVGHLQDGLLIDEDTGTAVGHLRGFIPQTGGQLQLMDGRTTAIVRSLAVDILEYRSGSYLVRLASGQQALYAGPLSAFALTAAALAQHCDTGYVNGFALRYSGELIPFNSCGEDAKTLTLGGSNDVVVADKGEVAGLIYVSERADRTQQAFVQRVNDAPAVQAPTSMPPATPSMEYEAQ